MGVGSLNLPLPLALLFALFVASLAATPAMAEIPGRGFLPDNRGWERVSPEDKNGYLLTPTGVHTSETGDALIYGSNGGPLPGTQTGVGIDILRGVRGSGGWTYSSLIPDAPFEYELGTNPPVVEAASADSSESLVFSHSMLTPDAPVTGGSGNLFLHKSNGTYQLVGAPSDSVGGSVIFVRYVGSSPDFSHVLIESSTPQTLDPVGGDHNPYEWVDGHLRLVSILPDPDGPGPLTEAPAPEGASIPGRLGLAPNGFAISEDGSRIFFQAAEPALGFEELGQLYLRQNGESTVQISRSQRTDCADHDPCADSPEPDPAGPLPARLQATATDGSAALFTSCEKLTDDSTADVSRVPELREAGLVFSPCADLYRYDVDSGELEDLTTQDSTGAYPGGESGSESAGIIGASSDLEKVYYVAEGNLAAGATAGRLNLYMYDHGVTTHLVTLDPPEDDPGAGGHPNELANFSSLRLGSSRVSDDGRYLVFTSRTSLLGYDNDNPAKCTYNTNNSIVEEQEVIEPSNGSCSEVYRYDSVEDQLKCLSCPANGTLSNGDAYLFSISPSADLPRARLPMNLLPDGTVFFMTPSRLVPQDSNGKIDVYEFRDGSPHLISDGQDATNARFVDATPNGSDVFFLTKSRLVGQDRDLQEDIYDARVNGGFPAPSLPPPNCQGDSCQPPPRRLDDPTPASLSYSGPGNQVNHPRKRHHRKKHHKNRHRQERHANHRHG